MIYMSFTKNKDRLVLLDIREVAYIAKGAIYGLSVLFVEDSTSTLRFVMGIQLLFLVVIASNDLSSKYSSLRFSFKLITPLTVIVLAFICVLVDTVKYSNDVHRVKILDFSP